jgi:hypothetical protein
MERAMGDIGGEKNNDESEWSECDRWKGRGASNEGSYVVFYALVCDV